MTGNIDYREAFVLDMEMAAHGPSCTQCMLAALKNNHDDFCHRMKYMQDNIKRAYEALPPYYKARYEEALNTALMHSSEAMKGLTGG